MRNSTLKNDCLTLEKSLDKQLEALKHRNLLLNNLQKQLDSYLNKPTKKYVC